MICWKKSAALLGLAAWAGPLALLSTMAQSQTAGTGICFQVTGPTELYAYPSLHAKVVANYEAGNVAYATTNKATSYWFDDGTEDGNSFVEVAIFDGLIAWVPRFQVGTDTALLVDSPTDECTEPGLNAYVYPPIETDEEYCLAVTKPVNLYAYPSFWAITPDLYARNDTAFATANPPYSVWIDDGTTDGNSFIEVKAYDGNFGWVPRFPEGDDEPPILVDLPSEECRIGSGEN